MDVDPDRDHIRGAQDAPVTIVEYGDFECPFCGQAEQVIRELLAQTGYDVRYVWRHLPLSDVHPYAQLAAEASEAAAAQDRFWEMYDLLLTHQGDLGFEDLEGYAERARSSTPTASPMSSAGASTRPNRRGRRQRRRERRLGNADVLHQRPPALRGLRHRRPEAGRAGRQEPGDAHRSHPQPRSLTAAINAGTFSSRRPLQGFGTVALRPSLVDAMQPRS